MSAVCVCLLWALTKFLRLFDIMTLFYKKDRISLIKKLWRNHSFIKKNLLLRLLYFLNFWRIKQLWRQLWDGLLWKYSNKSAQNFIRKIYLMPKTIKVEKLFLSYFYPSISRFSRDWSVGMVWWFEFRISWILYLGNF